MDTLSARPSIVNTHYDSENNNSIEDEYNEYIIKNISLKKSYSKLRSLISRKGD